MSGDFDPPMTRCELGASLAAFDLRWPFPRDGWNHGRTEIRPSRESYERARTEVQLGAYSVSIECAFKMEIDGERRDGPGTVSLLLRPDSFAPRDRWTIGRGQWLLSDE